MDACSEKGGGRAVVPAGQWKSRPIHLKSHVELHLEDGAVITFSDRFEDYLPVVFTRHEGKKCYHMEREAIQITMFYEYDNVPAGTTRPADFSDIIIRKVRGSGAETAVLMRGLPDRRLRGVTLEDINLTAENTILCSDVEGLTLNRVSLKAADRKKRGSEAK